MTHGRTPHGERRFMIILTVVDDGLFIRPKRKIRDGKRRAWVSGVVGKGQGSTGFIKLGVHVLLVKMKKNDLTIFF